MSASTQLSSASLDLSASSSIDAAQNFYNSPRDPSSRLIRVHVVASRPSYHVDEPRDTARPGR